jgi:hypothetical protein
MERNLNTGIGLSARRTTEQQGHLTISDSLFGQIIVDDESVLSRVAEVFA